MGMGLAPWYAAFMMRIHGMGTAELGLWLGIIFGGSGVVGTLLGGYASSHWFATNESGQMKLSAVVVALLVPSFALFLMLPEKHQALIALVPLVIVFNFFLGPTFALMQRLVAAEVRATSMAVVMLLCNIIGMGIGPQLVGVTSDLLAPAFGSQSLRYAMLMTSTVALWAAYHLWRVSHTVRMDIDAVSSQPALEMDSTPLFARER
jgi:predicted MFS family arabinose efflux permease